MTLTYNVILWYSFVVQSGGGGGVASLRDRPPARGGTITTLVGRLQGKGKVPHLTLHALRTALCMLW